MIVKLLTEHDLEFLSLNGGRRGSSEFTLTYLHVKMPHCGKSHALARRSFQIASFLISPRKFIGPMQQTFGT